MCVSAWNANEPAWAAGAPGWVHRRGVHAGQAGSAAPPAAGAGRAEGEARQVRGLVDVGGQPVEVGGRLGRLRRQRGVHHSVAAAFVVVGRRLGRLGRLGGARAAGGGLVRGVLEQSVGLRRPARRKGSGPQAAVRQDRRMAGRQDGRGRCEGGIRGREAGRVARRERGAGPAPGPGLPHCVPGPRCRGREGAD